MSEVRLYRPSNGTEGEGFVSSFCMECKRDEEFWRDEGPGCEIAARALIFDVDEEGYPTEWRYVDGVPGCTAFRPVDGPPISIDIELEAAGQLTLINLARHAA